MKKTLIALTLNLFISNSYAVSAAHSSAHATEVAHSSHAAIANMVAASSVVSSSAAHQKMIRAAQIQNNNASTMFVHEVAKGVLICKIYTSPNDNYLHNGCRVDAGIFKDDTMISIEDYFKYHKPIDGNYITMVIYNETKDQFEIYYS